MFSRIPHVQDTQCAWLLAHCASARANYLLRVMHPEAVEEFARRHDAGLWGRRPQSKRLWCSQCLLEDWFAECTNSEAFWASWADCLPMIWERHPTVVHQFMAELEGHPDTPILHAVAASVRSLTGVRGFTPPSWQALAASARPELREPDDYEPGSVRTGWQLEVASRVEKFSREDLFTRVGEDVQALIRSQGGPGADLVLSTCPTCRVTKLEAQLFRVVLLRRVRLPLCSLPLDPCGHHHAACAHAGVLGRRGWRVEECGQDTPGGWRTCCHQRHGNLIWHCPMSQMGGGWRSAPWIPLSCARCTGTGGLREEQLLKTGASDGSPPEERRSVPQIGWSRSTCTFGGDWRGGRWLGARNEAFPDPISEGKGS